MKASQFYYGWTIAWALAITQTVGFGILFYSFSVFIKPMEAELGWTRAQTSGAYSVALLLSGLIALPIGRWVDKRGARLLMTVGSSLGALLVLAWSFVTDIRVFYLIQAGIGMVMAATFYEVAFTVVAVWFRKHRKTAMLIVTLVAGLASTIFIPLSSYLVETMPWRMALRVLAAVLLFVAVPLHALVLRRNPQMLGLEPDGQSQKDAPIETSQSVREALHSSHFWWIAFAFTLDRITIIGVAAHSVPMLLEKGYSPATVAAATGAIGIMQLAGRLFFTPNTARFSLASLSAVTFAFHTLGLLMLLFVPGILSIWLFAGFHGMANGASTLARAGIIADTFGPANYGSISGSMATIIALVQTVAPLGAGVLHDRSGNYTLVIWLLALSSGLAALTVLQARPKPRL
ncbi:MAG: MFS transporter [Trueperaceae bacterium]|nr:MFS transporter [Trueperaceae bacterium]